MKGAMARWLSSLAFVLVLVGWTMPAHADPRTEYLVNQLKTSDDYRVRTQAALALGASGDAAAMDPLCKGLADSNAAVKTAAAAALGRLGRAEAATCLKAAKTKEKDASILTQIDQSIEKLAGGGDKPAPPGPNTKFYVAIQITNRTTRPTPEIEKIVRVALQQKIVNASGFAVAPRDETVPQGTKIVKGKNLKGYLLMASVEAPEYKNGNLNVTVSVTMWTYPDKALKAQFAPKLTMDRTPSQDVPGENELMKLASESAAQSFLKVAASL